MEVSEQGDMIWIWVTLVLSGAETGGGGRDIRSRVGPKRRTYLVFFGSTDLLAPESVMEGTERPESGGPHPLPCFLSSWQENNSFKRQTHIVEMK